MIEHLTIGWSLGSIPISPRFILRNQYLTGEHVKKEPTYDIYTKAFGKVRSGTKLTDKDYAYHSINGSTTFTDEEKLAVTIACDDVQNRQPLKTKNELETEIRRLLGP